MPIAFPNELKEQAKTLYVAGQPAVQIADKLGIKRDTILTWASRHKWQIMRQNVTDRVNAVLTDVVQKSLQQVGERDRKRLANVISQHIDVLEQTPARHVEDLRNTPEGEGLASVTKKVYETAAGLHGWGDEKQSGMILLTDVRQFEAQPQEAIVVSEANQVTDAPQPVDMAESTETTIDVKPLDSTDSKS